MTLYKIELVEVPYNDFDNVGNASVYELEVDKTLAEAEKLAASIQNLFELKLSALAQKNPEKFLPFREDSSHFTSVIVFRIDEVESAQTNKEDWENIVSHLLEWEPYFSNENS